MFQLLNAEASMDRSTLAKTKKFDISYIIAKEKLAFTKRNRFLSRRRAMVLI